MNECYKDPDCGLISSFLRLDLKTTASERIGLTPLINMTKGVIEREFCAQQIVVSGWNRGARFGANRQHSYHRTTGAVGG